jgi:hypothetical protein
MIVPDVVQAFSPMIDGNAVFSRANHAFVWW